MSDVAKILKDVGKLIDKNGCIKTTHAEESKRIEAEIGVKIKNIQELIIAGKTSGDRLEDFLLVCTGKISKTLLKAYRELEGMFSGKKGELILVISRMREEHGPIVKYLGVHGCNGILDRNSKIYKFKERFVLGILSDEKILFNLKEKTCVFPTDGKHVIWEDKCPKIDKHKSSYWPDLTFANVFSPPHAVLAMSQSVPVDLGHPLWERGTLPVLEVIVGSRSVSDFFTKTMGAEYIPAYFQALRALDYTMQDVDLMKYRNDRLDQLANNIAGSVFETLHLDEQIAHIKELRRLEGVQVQEQSTRELKQEHSNQIYFVLAQLKQAESLGISAEEVLTKAKNNSTLKIESFFESLVEQLQAK